MKKAHRPRTELTLSFLEEKRAQIHNLKLLTDVSDCTRSWGTLRRQKWRIALQFKKVSSPDFVFSAGNIPRMLRDSYFLCVESSET